MDSVHAQTPKFNHQVLYDYREQSIAAIPRHLDDLFSQAEKIINGHQGDGPKCEYIGSRPLLPAERLVERSKYGNPKVNIRSNTCVENVFSFKFNNNIFECTIPIPFMKNRAIHLNGVEYFPLLGIVESGSVMIEPTHNKITLKVMRANIKIYRHDPTVMTATDGRVFSATLITSAIHQKPRNVYPPLVLYLVTKYSFVECMDRLNVDVSFTTEVGDDDATYFQFGNGIFVRVPKNPSKEELRTAVALWTIYQTNRKIDLNNLRGYFIATLAKYTYPTALKVAVGISNVKDHLNMNETLLDSVAKEAFAKQGIVVNNIGELLLVANSNIDKWLSEYMPNDLLNKSIGNLDYMAAILIRQFNTRLFSKVINTKTGLTEDTLKKLLSLSSRNKWITDSKLFRSKPTQYNDNYLLSIGCKRLRTESTDSASKKSKYTLSTSAMKAHFSSLIVESILCYPSSSPIVSGTINPYVQIKEDGSIVTPPWVHEIEDVFNT